jgi:hypothetical protein
MKSCSAMGRKVDTSPEFKDSVGLVNELTEADKEHIRSVFHEKMIPKLARYSARIGNLSCEFAGARYRNWCLQFRSAGSDFVIVDFEPDDDASAIDLS